MADKMQRYSVCMKGTCNCAPGVEEIPNGAWVLHSEYYKLETELRDMTIDRDLWQSDHNEDCPNAASLESIQALHASIIEQGRLVQIGASGESKYGAMSAGEYIEWVKGELGGK